MPGDQPWIEVRDTGTARFSQVIRIYREAFPANERHTESRIAERVSSGFYKLLVCEKDGVNLFALLHELKGTPYVLLDYFALRQDMRGGGLGSIFFAQLVAYIADHKQRLVLEVEDPAFGDNAEERAKRMRFYTRHGARIFQDVPYKLPPFVEGSPPTDMKLLLIPCAQGESFTGDEIKDLVTRLYREVYLRDRRNPLLQSILSKIPEHVALA